MASAVSLLVARLQPRRIFCRFAVYQAMASAMVPSAPPNPPQPVSTGLPYSRSSPQIGKGVETPWVRPDARSVYPPWLKPWPSTRQHRTTRKGLKPRRNERSDGDNDAVLSCSPVQLLACSASHLFPCSPPQAAAPRHVRQCRKQEPKDKSEARNHNSITTLGEVLHRPLPSRSLC